VVEVYNISLAYNIALPYNISLAYKYLLVWTPDDTRLLLVSRSDPTIRAWGTSTWKQVGDPCTGHTGYIYAFAVDATGALVASASPSRVVITMCVSGGSQIDEPSPYSNIQNQ
jgi:WD40 repeat protein